jgi:hypothetical protein
MLPLLQHVLVEGVGDGHVRVVHQYIEAAETVDGGPDERAVTSSATSPTSPRPCPMTFPCRSMCASPVLNGTGVRAERCLAPF